MREQDWSVLSISAYKGKISEVSVMYNYRNKYGYTVLNNLGSQATVLVIMLVLVSIGNITCSISNEQPLL